MRTKGTLWLVLFFIVSGVQHAPGQTYPSSIVTSLIGSRTIFLDEYANSIDPRIRTTIRFTDFTEPSWQFALRLTITGPNGLLIKTKVGARPAQPLSVIPGQPFVIEGFDLAFYFNYDNLDFAGIHRSELELNHRLPEGHYIFPFSSGGSDKE